jgi:prepilin-type N-terminal cleavage/methylation domain-containing protein
MTRKEGFTLIEIIVVLIILGVLSAIAIPSLFNNIERSKAIEVMLTLKGWRELVEGCLAAKDNDSNCMNAAVPNDTALFLAASSRNVQTGGGGPPGNHVSYILFYYRNGLAGDSGGTIPSCGPIAQTAWPQSGVGICRYLDASWNPTFKPLSWGAYNGMFD